MALRGDEGRDKLRKASVSCKRAIIRRYPNGTTHQGAGLGILILLKIRRQTRGTETSKYPEEKKTTVIPQVVASERGLAQTIDVTAFMGL